MIEVLSLFPIQFINKVGVDEDPDAVLSYALNVFIPQGVEAHQVPCMDVEDNDIQELVSLSQKRLTPEKVRLYAHLL